MDDKTRIEYEKIAKHFFKIQFADDEDITPKTITDKLKASALTFRPNYWGRLRRALELDQIAKGFPKSAERINKTKNPLTSNKSKRKLIKPKQQRIKKVSEDDYNKLVKHFSSKTKVDKETLSAIVVSHYLGVRPSELLSLKINSDGSIFVTGSKKEATGLRGLDRTIKVDDEEIKSALHKCIKVLSNTNVTAKQIQDRLALQVKKVFPRRKNKISLYSFRHQCGSNLKASSLSKKEVALMMGHQSTASVEQYGNKRSSNGSLSISVANTKELDSVRELSKNIEVKPSKPRHEITFDF